jgi:hypothetical protein
MNRYKKYHIKNTDRFNPYDFPKVQDELTGMINATQLIPAMNKEKIIISYLKDHSIENDLVSHHPELVSLLTGKQFSTSDIESLFDSCRHNQHFLSGFEDFIRHSLAEQPLLKNQ